MRTTKSSMSGWPRWTWPRRPGWCACAPRTRPGQAGDVLGDEPADGAAGVDADDDPAAGVEHETGGLQVGRVGVDEGAGRVRDGGGVGAMTDREPQAVPGDQVPCGGF